ncbi:MAG: GNAT family N-acetyltransferase [Vicinamibacterales bacterium]
MIEVREAAPSDMGAVREIFAEYMRSIAHLAASSFAHQRVDEELQTLPGRYGPPGGAIVLAWEAGVSVGCAAVRPLDGAGTCELKRMYVKPAHRRTGLGRRLALAALARARDMGYRTVKLDSDPALLPALALYRSLGFVPTARYNQDPDPETVYLARDL